MIEYLESLKFKMEVNYVEEIFNFALNGEKVSLELIY